MITVLIQPLHNPGQENAGRLCDLLFENIKSRLDASQQDYLRSAANGKSGGLRRMMSLLARALVLKYLPGHILRRLPGTGLMAGQTFISLSYGRNCVFCGLGSRPLGLDAEEILADAGAMKGFFRQIRADCPASMGCSALVRSWTVCEAILKLTGTGWTAAAKDLLGGIPFELRCKSSRTPGLPNWHTIPFHGHWLAIASASKIGKITCKLLPAFVP